jgi:hypothetical protein
VAAGDSRLLQATFEGTLELLRALIGGHDGAGCGQLPGTQDARLGCLVPF